MYRSVITKGCERLAYTVEWNPLLENQDLKRTLARLHVTFMTLGFMSIT